MPLRSVFSVVFFGPLVAGKFTKILHQFRGGKSIYFIFFRQASRRCYQSLDQYPQYLVDCPEEYEHCYKKIKGTFSRGKLV